MESGFFVLREQYADLGQFFLMEFERILEENYYSKK